MPAGNTHSASILVGRSGMELQQLYLSLAVGSGLIFSVTVFSGPHCCLIGLLKVHFKCLTNAAYFKNSSRNESLSGNQGETLLVQPTTITMQPRTKTFTVSVVLYLSSFETHNWFSL